MGTECRRLNLNVNAMTDNGLSVDLTVNDVYCMLMIHLKICSKVKIMQGILFFAINIQKLGTVV